MGQGLRSRDYQRAKCYTAEHQGVKPCRTFATIADCQAYADTVMTRLGHRPVVVVAAHPNATASSGGYSKISLLDTMQNDVVLLHEIAHTIITRKYWGRQDVSIPGHGAQWASCFVGLMERFCPDHVEELTHSFARFGVDVDDERHDAVILREGK